MRQLYPVVPFEPSRNYLINISNGRKSFLININAEGRISAAYSALLQQSGGLRRSLPSGRVRSSPLPWGERATREARRGRGQRGGEGRGRTRASRESVIPHPPSLRSGTLSLWERESANASPLSSAKLFIVITGLVPVIPLRRAMRVPKQDARVKPGHDAECVALPGFRFSPSELCLLKDPLFDAPIRAVFWVPQAPRGAYPRR